MVQFMVQPESVRAMAQPRGRFAWALTDRTLYLLLAGCLFLLPAFFHARYAFGMLAWDIAVLCAAATDAARLPKPSAIEVERTWLGAPSLGREVKVEIALTQHGRALLRCRCIDNLPSPFLETPANHALDLY